MFCNMLSTPFVHLYGFFSPMKVLLIFLFSSAIASFSYGQQKNFFVNNNEPSWIVKVKPKNLKPSPKDISEGYFASFYESQSHLELHEDYHRLIREIVSDAGVQNGSQISVTYDPSFQKLIFHKILVWRDGKSYNRLKINDFKLLQTEKELSRFIYSGTFDAFMLLDDVRKNDRIEFSYTITGLNPVFGKKYADAFYFEGSSSVGHIYNNIILSKSRSLALKNFNFNENPHISEKNGLRIYEWESTLTKTYRAADYEPTWYNPLKRTQLSEYKNWNEVVQWALSINDYTNLRTPLVDKKVKELRAESGADLKKYITLATRFVQDEIRYMGIEIGIYSHRPNSPEKVLLQRYGDCKDKSLLLVHLLKAQGINAYMTYANTYTTIKTDEYLPSPFVFNHVIVLVDYNNYKTWIDPTISYQRGTFDSFYAPDYGSVLIIKKGVNTLEKIERKPLGKLIANLRFNLADTVSAAKSSLLVTSIYSDNYADELRRQIAESGTDGMEKSFLEYLAKLYPEIETKEQIKVEDNEEGNVIEVTESYEIGNIWNENNEIKDQVVYFYGDMISSELRKITTKKRLAPLALKDYINIEQNITVDMPYNVSVGDDTFQIENDSYYFDMYQIQRPREIKFSYTFRNSVGYLENDKIKDYAKDIKKIDEYLTHYIKRGGTAEANNHINFYMLIPYLFCLAGSALFFLKLYKKNEPFIIEDIADALPIGGWLVLIAMRVMIFPIILLTGPFLIRMFKNEAWNGLANFGNWEGLLKFTFIAEAMIYAFLFTYSVFCLILFFQRRKSFPKHFIIITTGHLGFLIFDTAIASSMNSILGKTFVNPKDLGSVFGSLIYCIIFVWYLLASERVKQTFVFTYPKSVWQLALAKYHDHFYAKKDEQIQLKPLTETNDNNENI